MIYIRVPFLLVWSAPVDPLYCIPPISDRNPGLSPCFHWLPYFNSLKIPCLFTSPVDVCSSRRLPAVLACADQCLIFCTLPACCVSVRENVEARTSPRVPGPPTQVLWVQTENAQSQWSRNHNRLKRGRFSNLSIYYITHDHVRFISQFLRKLLCYI